MSVSAGESGGKDVEEDAAYEEAAREENPSSAGRAWRR